MFRRPEEPGFRFFIARSLPERAAAVMIGPPSFQLEPQLRAGEDEPLLLVELHGPLPMALRRRGDVDPEPPLPQAMRLDRLDDPSADPGRSPSRHDIHLIDDAVVAAGIDGERFHDGGDADRLAGVGPGEKNREPAAHATQVLQHLGPVDPLELARARPPILRVLLALPEEALD